MVRFRFGPKPNPKTPKNWVPVTAPVVELFLNFFKIILHCFKIIFLNFGANRPSSKTASLGYENTTFETTTS